MRPEPAAMPSKGYGYSIPMLAVMCLELGMLLDIPFGHYTPALGILLAAAAATALLQLSGILLVVFSRYRAGAWLQFIGSGVHVLDILGIVGIVGAAKAYKYPERIRRSQA